MHANLTHMMHQRMHESKSSKFTSRLTKTEQDLSEFVKTGVSQSKISHLPVLPSLQDRHEFIGKWFGGKEEDKPEPKRDEDIHLQDDNNGDEG